jgi:hypothetical protein
MISFKYYFNNKNKVITESSEYFYRYKKKWVIDTFHALERRDQRLSLSDDELKDFFRGMIDNFLSKGVSYLNRDGKYLYYSKKYKQAILIEYRQDRRVKNSPREFIVISYYKPGTQNARKDTPKIVIESSTGSPYISSECANYLLNNSINSLICEDEYNHKTLIMEDTNNKYTNINFIFDDDNKIWDIENIEVLEF